MGRSMTGPSWFVTESEGDSARDGEKWLCSGARVRCDGVLEIVYRGREDAKQAPVDRVDMLGVFVELLHRHYLKEFNHVNAVGLLQEKSRAPISQRGFAPSSLTEPSPQETLAELEGRRGLLARTCPASRRIAGCRRRDWVPLEQDASQQPIFYNPTLSYNLAPCS